MSTTSDWTATPQPAAPLPVPAAQSPFPRNWTMADVQKHVGGVPAKRIRVFPLPGTATVEDALEIEAREDRICELVDGILVEKPMASFESLLAVKLIVLLEAYLKDKARGIVLGESGSLRILPRRMRVPDVSFISWDRFPNRQLPKDAVWRVAPDLAVEIISKGSTKGEMDLKLDEYFQAGVRLVWYIDPRTKTATIHAARDQAETIDTAGYLDGRDVLPGFRLRLGELLDRAAGAE